MNFFSIITQKTKKFSRSIRLRIRTRNVDVNASRTILCNMCLGGVISHDYGFRFNSPTVNLMIPAREFVDLIRDLNQIGGSITKKVDVEKPYPVGLLNNKYTLHFVHYKTFEEAIDTWKRRVSRMDMCEPYIILVETASCCYDDLVKFEQLPYKNKIALVHCNYPDIQCSTVINGFDGQNLHGEILNYKGLFGKRMYDDVDWRKFLNL